MGLLLLGVTRRDKVRCEGATAKPDGGCERTKAQAAAPLAASRHMPPSPLRVCAAMPVPRRASTPLLGAFFLTLFASSARAQNTDRIWGRVFTEDGSSYEGFLLLRGTETAGSWADIFEARRTIPEEHYLDWLDATRDGLPATRTIELRGYRVSWEEKYPDFTATVSTGIRLGQVATLVTTEEGDVQIVPRSGGGGFTMAEPAQPTGDLPDTIRTRSVTISLRGVQTSSSSTWDAGASWRRFGVYVEDPDGGGHIRIRGGNVRRIEFAAPPTDARATYRRLYGVVQDRSGRTFSGAISWLHSMLDGDSLHTRRGDQDIPFSAIHAVEEHQGGVRVTLTSGDIVEDQVDHVLGVWTHGSGIRIADPALGTVHLEWDAFSSLQLEDPPDGLGYDSFDGGHPLFGTVVTRQGDEITGRIRWDADEEWSWELLNGRSDDVDFQIEFGNIEHIEANEDGGARVTLLDGRSFELDGSNDVSADNKGIFVFPPSDEIPEAERDSERPAWRYISWEDFREARFQHPSPPGAGS